MSSASWWGRWSRSTARSARASSSPGPGRHTTSCPEAAPRGSHDDDRRAGGRADRPGRPAARGRSRDRRRHHAERGGGRPRLRAAAGADQLGGQRRGEGAPSAPRECRVIELYALTDDPAPSLPAGAPLSTVAHAGLAFVWAPAPATTGLSPELLWRHEELLEKLMEDGDLLPVRFGPRLADEADAARALRERHHELALALDRVRGAVELSVRVIGTEREPPPAEGMSGTEYLRAREQTSAARASALRTVHEPLSLGARASSERAPRA